MSALLEVEGLRVRLPTPAGFATVVDGVDYHVEPAQVFGVAGESGSGKTMSMLALLGLLPAGAVVEGRAEFGGKDLLRLDARALRAVSGRDIGMVFQDPMTSLHPMLSVGRQLTEHMRRHLGLGRTAATQRAVDLLEQVRIPDPQQRAACLSASVLGWNATARRDRDRACLRSQAADRRRAYDRPGCDGPGRDPAAARRPASRA